MRTRWLVSVACAAAVAGAAGLLLLQLIIRPRQSWQRGRKLITQTRVVCDLPCHDLATAGYLFYSPRFPEALEYVRSNRAELESLLEQVMETQEKDASWLLVQEAIAAADDVFESLGIKATSAYKEAWRSFLSHSGTWKSHCYFADTCLLQGLATEAQQHFAKALELCERECAGGGASVEAALVQVSLV